MKITEDFIGNETKELTKTKIATILRWWGFNPDSYSTWGNARVDMNNILSGASSSTISDRERASSFLSKINYINDTDTVISNTLFANNEPGVWYDPSDLSTLFQDATGNTPVTAVEQPVGLMLDKSKGLVVGSEIFPQPTFDDTTGLTLDPTWVVSGGVATADGSSGFIYAYQALQVGKWYSYSMDVVSSVSGAVYVPYDGRGVNNRLAYTPGTYKGVFLAETTTLYIYSHLFVGSIDNVSVRELSGNHAYQMTATSRPVLSARYNLLTKTEQFDDAAWSKQSISAVTTTALDGTQTAFKLVPAAEANAHVVFQAGITPLANCVVRFYAKAAGYSTLTVYEFPNASSGASFNLATGSVTNVNSGVGTITPAGDGWYLCTVTVSLTGVLFYIPSTNSVFVGDGASGVTIWRPSVVASNAGVNLPPYQRVNTATDYDTVGFPHYLKCDGVDDGMVTNSIDFTSTNTMTLVAGLRKVSDSTALPVELSSDYNNVPGSMYLSSGANPSNGYRATSRGTGAANADQGSAWLGNAPDTSVLAASHNIPGDNTTLRRNGVAQTPGTFDKGSGNFGNYPLYLFRRGDTVLPFNGQFYGLVIVGKLLSDNQLISTEKYINGLTKAY